MQIKTKNRIFAFIMALSLVLLSICPTFATEDVTTEEGPSVETTAYQVEEEATYSINFRAVDPDGNPISELEFAVTAPSGSRINFVKSNGVFVYTENGFYQTVATDSNGSFTISGLEQGTYTIEYTNNNPDYVATTSSKVEAGDGASATMNLKRNIGDMNFTLTGEDGSTIGGAKFVIVNSSGKNVSFNTSGGMYVYASSGDEELETNTAGIINVRSLPVGDYTIKQTSSPVEYNGDLVSQSFTITLGNQTNVSATSEKRYGNVTISLNDGSSALNGGQFNILNSSGSKVYFANNAFSRNSGSDVITVNGTITLSGLPVGEYKLVQTKAPSGYIKAGDKSFTIKKNSTETVTVSNAQDVGSLRIEVKDGTSSEAVQGYGFALADANGNPLTFTKNSDGDYTYSASGSESTLISNANGVILAKGLPPKTYVVKQTRAAAGYIIDTAESQQSITNGNTTTYEVSVFKSNTSITVVDEDNVPLEGIVLEIHNDDGNVVFEGQTNDSGKLLIAGIPAGNYSYLIKDLGSPFINKEYEAKFTINGNGEVAALEPCVLEYNKVVIDIKQKVAGAKFTLTDATNNNNVLTAETDENGIATFTKVEDGVYALKQTEAPAGYQVSDKKETVSVDRTVSKALNYEFKNTPIGNSSESEQASESETTTERDGKSTFPIVPVVIGILVLLGAVIFAIMKTKKDEENEENKENKDGETKKPDVAPENKATTVIPPVFINDSKPEPEEEEPEEEPEPEEVKPLTVEERRPQFDTYVDPYEQEEVENLQAELSEPFSEVIDQVEAEEAVSEVAEAVSSEVPEEIPQEEIKEEAENITEEVKEEVSEELPKEIEETEPEAVQETQSEDLTEAEKAEDTPAEVSEGEAPAEEVKEEKAAPTATKPRPNPSAKSRNYNNRSKKGKKRKRR